MTVTLQQVNPTRTRVYMGTITDDADVHASLLTVAEKHGIQTATFELLGGLREVEFRAFEFDSLQRKAPLHFQRALEIVTGHGTISMLEGKPHVHLHLAVAYQDVEAPNRVVVLAGHCAKAVAFAIEFTLTAYEDNTVHRAKHEGTGLMLWDLPKL
ncbi:MAG TPA: PPC domain-containing DNA-binding protein [Anaerolineales bacterium]|nr:PPC domain-containing DNA-binding protein [Anaerolineales bacterium]